MDERANSPWKLFRQGCRGVLVLTRNVDSISGEAVALQLFLGHALIVPRFASYGQVTLARHAWTWTFLWTLVTNPEVR